MFCRNCGNEMTAEAAVCVKCGVPAGKGKKFCPNCGFEHDPEAVICVQCGATLEQPAAAKTEAAPTGAKSKLVAGLLGIFLGCFGVHNFYLGFTGKAVAQLLITVLTCFAGSTISGIWGLIEGIMLLVGKVETDAKGNPLAE